jgi:hypothetical protein
MVHIHIQEMANGNFMIQKIFNMKTKFKVYEFGESPLEEAHWFIDGEKYVTSSGDILEWNEEIQDFNKIGDSPLDETLQNNTMENLTRIQLDLFWTLCK